MCDLKHLEMGRAPCSPSCSSTPSPRCCKGFAFTFRSLCLSDLCRRPRELTVIRFSPSVLTDYGQGSFFSLFKAGFEYRQSSPEPCQPVPEQPVPWSAAPPRRANTSLLWDTSLQGPQPPSSRPPSAPNRVNAQKCSSVHFPAAKTP